MAGPGGREVGRVSVRVVPNTDGFRDKVKSFLTGLERTLKLKVDLEIDPAALRRLRSGLPTLRPPVRPDTGGARRDIDVLRAQISALQARLSVTANTREGLRQAYALTQQINRLRAEIDVKVKTDRAGLGGLGDGSGRIRALTGALGALFSAGSKLPGLFGSIAGVFGTATSAGSKFGGVVGELLGGLGGIAPMLGKVAGPIGVLVTGIFGIGAAVLGAGAKLASFAITAGIVTFAVGALGAAVSGLPALLFGLGGAAATVFLGLDGIKKAAEAAKPALEKLKSQVSAVFTKELTPAFERLGKVLPQLRTGFETVAVGVSGFVRSLLGVVTSTQGVKDLQRALTGVDVLVRNLTPGVTALVGSLLRAATVTGIYREIGELVNGLSLQFAGLFDRFAEGGESSLMVRAFTQLKEVLLAASGAFTEFLYGATEFFTAAGPGVKEFFDSLKNTLAKIDFKSLGESFGTFAAAAGRLIESVPPETWQRIADSVKNMADRFSELANNPNVQAFFAGLLEVVPLIMDYFAGFEKAIEKVANGLRKIGDLNDTVLGAIGELGSAVTGFFTGSGDEAEKGGDRVKNATSLSWSSVGSTIRDKAAGALQSVRDFCSKQIEAVRNLGSRLATAARIAWTVFVATVKAKINDAVAAARELPGKVKNALGNLGSLLLESGKALVRGFVNGIKSMGSTVASAAKGIVSKARDFFPFSPAKEGPFSGRGWVRYSGEAIGLAFADGLLAKRAQVAKAADYLTRSAALFDDVRAHRLAGQANAAAYAAGVESRAVSAGRAIAAVAERIDPLTGSVSVGADDATGPLTADAIAEAVAVALEAVELRLDTRRGEAIARLANRGNLKVASR